MTLPGAGATVRRLMDAGLRPSSRSLMDEPTVARWRAAASRGHRGADRARPEVVLRIIHSLGERTQRFCEARDALGGANSATLSQRLKLLEGLISRRVVSSVPPWVSTRSPQGAETSTKRWPPSTDGRTDGPAGLIQTN